MDIDHIHHELSKINLFGNHTVDYERLSGGTSSSVFAVLIGDHPRFVIKINAPSMIESESVFLAKYAEIDLLSNLVYVDPAYRFLVYTYKPGTTRYVKGDKECHLESLVNDLLNRYKWCDLQGYGYIDDPVSSWREFLAGRAIDSRAILTDTLAQEEHQFISDRINSMAESKLKYLIHGDCGVHNFIFNNGIMTGIIDSTPIAGEPIYDLIYAFCSSPEDLSYAVIEHAIRTLDKSLIMNRNINEEVIIGLYFRMATCILHHPSDLNDYLEAWSYWKQRVNKK